MNLASFKIPSIPPQEFNPTPSVPVARPAGWGRRPSLSKSATTTEPPTFHPPAHRLVLCTLEPGKVGGWAGRAIPHLLPHPLLCSVGGEGRAKAKRIVPFHPLSPGSHHLHPPSSSPPPLSAQQGCSQRPSQGSSSPQNLCD